ncbi:glycosyltransferase [Georgenia sp. M64]|uniref:glycosyltransferase n=2 Tax=Georgenia sp. M64 TaxID=3120520 RepID=UPI0030DE824E
MTAWRWVCRRGGSGPSRWPRSWHVSREAADVRVVFTDHTTVPGGAQLALSRLLAASAGWDASLVVPRGPLGAYAALSRGGPVGVVRAGPTLRPGAGSAELHSQVRHALDVMRQVGALVLRQEVRRADVLYANSARSAVYTTVVGALLRKPVVVHLRDAVSRQALGTTGYKAMTRLVLPRAAAVVANSRYTLELAERCAPLSGLTSVIHSPVGDVSSGEPPAPRLKVERIGMVARISPWKGQDLLIKAFALAYPGEDVTLHLAGAPLFGESDHLARLRQLATELGVAERVVFHGHVRDVGAFIDSLDIAVQCSTQPEPLGQNVLQYLTRGRPVVAMAEGGPLELVGDGVTGVLIPPRDVEALVIALQGLSGPEVRRSLSNAARGSALAVQGEALHRTHDLLSAVLDREFAFRRYSSWCRNSGFDAFPCVRLAEWAAASVYRRARPR